MIDKIEQIFRSQHFADLTAEALKINEWFTHSDIRYAVEAIETEFLNREKLQNFISHHKIDTAKNGATLGIISAGNLPLVGFGDMFYTLLTGCRTLLKPSSKDPLMRAFAVLDGVTIVESIDELTSVDGIIAMGSDSTCAMIGERFPTTPTLLRGSMHSIAILTGDETPAELTALADDIFRYCSRGCRSVTHLYLPVNYDIEKLKFEPRDLPRAWNDCYRYERARAIINGEQFTDAGYYIIKEGAGSATAVINYSFYSNRDQIDLQGVQHIATRENFGRAQHPTLEDFSGGRNVIEFLKGLN